jgi:hypothetical protein
MGADGAAGVLARPRGVRREHGRSALRPANNNAGGPKIRRFFLLLSLFPFHFQFSFVCLKRRCGHL